MKSEDYKYNSSQYISQRHNYGMHVTKYMHSALHLEFHITKCIAYMEQRKQLNCTEQSSKVFINQT